MRAHPHARCRGSVCGGCRRGVDTARAAAHTVRAACPRWPTPAALDHILKRLVLGCLMRVEEQVRLRRIVHHAHQRCPSQARAYGARALNRPLGPHDPHSRCSGAIHSVLTHCCGALSAPAVRARMSVPLSHRQSGEHKSGRKDTSTQDFCATHQAESPAPRAMPLAKHACKGGEGFGRGAMRMLPICCVTVGGGCY